MSSEFGIRELLNAYRRGVFPMADSRDDPHLFLIDPDERGVLPLKGFHIPSRLARTVRQDHFEITVDRAFSRVMEGCAEASEGR
ncbi:MAG: leucyl/phenylalanyl-tRNA--protein transferase, partial [Pseudomonadota bacterium]